MYRSVGVDQVYHAKEKRSLRFDGCFGGWDSWMDGWIDWYRWVGGWLGRHMDGGMDGWVGWVDGIVGWIDW